MKNACFSGKRQQSLRYFLISGITCRCPGNDNQIIALIKACFLMAVAFPDQPAEMMSYHTVSDFLTDRNAKTVIGEPVFPHIQDQIPVCKGSAVSVTISEVVVFFQ